MMVRTKWHGKDVDVPLGAYLKVRSRYWLKSLKHALLWLPEWLAIAIGLLLLTSLPRRAMFATCDLLSRLMFRFDRRGRRHAEDNLAVMFPQSALLKSSAARERIIRRSYRNMARTIGYAFWTFRSARRRAAETGRVEPRLAELLAAHPQVVAVSAHLGCWELTSQMATLAGHSMISVAKNIGTKGMTKLLMRARRAIGQEIVPAEGAFKSLAAAVKAGKSLGLLVDQHIRAEDGGVELEFFGQPYRVSPAPAFFAAKRKLPIVIAWARPERGGTYAVELLDFIRGDEARDLKGTTRRVTATLERAIRRRPDCWALNYNAFGDRPQAQRKEADA